MFKLEDFKVNPVTGSSECNFNAKLMNINESSVQTNKNGTQYRICKIAFTNDAGVVEESSAQLYESNYEKGLVIGEVYMCTAVITERDEPLIFVSPLVANASRAKVSSFGAIAAKLQAEAKAKASTPVMDF